MKKPRHCLSVLLGRHLSIVQSPVDDVSHLLESSVLNNISTLSVENLACKKTPENLEHELRVLLGLVDQDFLQTVQNLFRLFVLSLFIQDLGILL